MQRRIVYAIIYLAYTSIYIARVNLSIAGTELVEQDIMSTAQIGVLGSIFSTVYAVGRLVNGGLSDKRPPWFMLTTGLVFAGISNIFFGFFPPFIGIVLLWMANAYAQSMLWSSALCVISSIFEKEVAKKKNAYMVTSVAVGNILGIIINTFLITKHGVEFAFIVPGIITIFLGIFVFFSTKEIQATSKKEKKHLSIQELLTHKELCAMLIPAFLHGMIKDNISLWMAVYIVEQYGVDLTTSAYYILFIPVIGFIGRMLYPLCYSVTRENEHRVSLLGFIASAIFSLCLCFKTHMIVAVFCLSVIYAAISMVNSSILSIYPLHYLKTGNVASVSGIMDFATYLGAGVGSMVYGFVLENAGYMPMFLSWVIVSVFSVVVIRKVCNRKEGA